MKRTHKLALAGAATLLSSVAVFTGISSSYAAPANKARPARVAQVCVPAVPNPSDYTNCRLVRVQGDTTCRCRIVPLEQRQVQTPLDRGNLVTGAVLGLGAFGLINTDRPGDHGGTREGFASNNAPGGTSPGTPGGGSNAGGGSGTGNSGGGGHSDNAPGNYSEDDRTELAICQGRRLTDPPNSSFRRCGIEDFVDKNAFFSVLALLPVIGIPMVLGGLEFFEFSRVVLALLNMLFLSLAAGIWVSAYGGSQTGVVTRTLIALLTLVCGLPLLGALWPSASSGGGRRGSGRTSR